MTILMDNSADNPARERVQRLFNQNSELENRRRKAAQARVPSDPNTWQKMRENFQAILLEDHAFSEQHEIEYALWQLHYRRIEELRATFNAVVASAGSNSSQNGKGQARGGSDRVTKIRTQFKAFLTEATGFYHDLMLKIRAKYGLPLGYLSGDFEGQIPLSEDGSRSIELKKGLLSCHRCFIYLGDLAPYKGLYGDGDSKALDFASASSLLFWLHTPVMNWLLFISTFGALPSRVHLLLQTQEPIPVTQLVRETAEVMQEFTQPGGVRPFGVSLLLAGFDDKGPQLYQVDPSGSYFSWKASAMEKNVSNAKTFLEKRFEGQISRKNIEIGIFRNDKKFTVLSPAEVEDYLKEVE